MGGEVSWSRTELGVTDLKTGCKDLRRCGQSGGKKSGELTLQKPKGRREEGECLVAVSANDRQRKNGRNIPHGYGP